MGSRSVLGSGQRVGERNYGSNTSIPGYPDTGWSAYKDSNPNWSMWDRWNGNYEAWQNQQIKNWETYYEYSRNKVNTESLEYAGLNPNLAYGMGAASSVGSVKGADAVQNRTVENVAHGAGVVVAGVQALGGILNAVKAFNELPEGLYKRKVAKLLDPALEAAEINAQRSYRSELYGAFNDLHLGKYEGGQKYEEAQFRGYKALSDKELLRYLSGDKSDSDLLPEVFESPLYKGAKAKALSPEYANALKNIQTAIQTENKDNIINAMNELVNLRQKQGKNIQMQNSAYDAINMLDVGSDTKVVLRLLYNILNDRL